jgi:hypothetical protein
VSAGQAGTTIACECGRSISVPSLGKLRELTGRGRYEAGTIDRIYAMIKSGQLPSGERCVVSGEYTHDVFDLWVQAEKIFTGDENRFARFLVAFFISPLLIRPYFQPERANVGRETFVPTPLRVAPSYHGRVRAASQRKLKRWLRSIPIYAELLHEYPLATVSVREPGHAS